ncbi:MAG: tetratricopeptide repeat protein [Candidatus Micrarchaeota archaeon]|nr:tetratricopeptide repeat protein [Candidatus Micrarchaeota archaeon]
MIPVYATPETHRAPEISRRDSGRKVPEIFRPENAHGAKPLEEPANQKGLSTSHMATLHFNLGMAFMKQKKFENAVREFKLVVSLKPEDAKAHFQLGNAYYQRGLTHLAAEAYEKAVKLKPDYAKAWANLGSALYEEGKFQEAKAAFEKVLSLDSNIVHAHKGLGMIALNEKDLRGAQVHFEKELELSPDSAVIHIKLGEAHLRNYFRRGEATTEAAEAHFKKALFLDPDSVDAHIGIGRAKWRKKDLKMAEFAFKMAVSLDPKSAKANCFLGSVYSDKGDLGKAIFFLSKAISLDPGLDTAHHNLGITYSRLSRNKVVVSKDVKVLGIDVGPLYTGANKGCMEQAASCFKKAIELNPGNALYRTSLAIAYALLGKPQKAIPHFKEAIRLVEETPDRHVEPKILHHALGLAYSKSLSAGRAVKHFERAIELGFDRAAGEMGIAFAYLGAENYAKVAEHSEKAINANPFLADAYFLLAKAKDRLGELEGAIKAVETVLELERGSKLSSPLALEARVLAIEIYNKAAYSAARTENYAEAARYKERISQLTSLTGGAAGRSKNQMSLPF